MKYDWALVQVDITAGMTVRKAMKKYGFAKRSLEKAVKRGDIISRRMSFVKDKSLPQLLRYVAGRRTSPRERAHIRRHLSIKKGRHECDGCGVSEWLGKRLTLEVDHIDGNPRNNRLGNLRLLCPNCHSITETWRGRNCRK